MVGVGDVVAEDGRPLARVGNSGNTSEPHLHTHVQTRRISRTHSASSARYPVLFSNTVLIRGGDAGPPATPTREAKTSLATSAAR
jgi:hypothetical protein